MANEPRNPTPQGVTPIPHDHELAKTSDAPKPVQPAQAAHDDHEAMPTDLKAPSGIVIAGVSIAFVVLLIVIFLVGFIPDYREKQATRKESEDEARRAPVAIWGRPEPSTGESKVILPCDITANQSTPLYTRANGFLESLVSPGGNPKKPNDIGTLVKKDQVLAIISTPDVDAQVLQSQAAEAVAEANVKGARAARDAAEKTYGFNVKAQQEKPGSVSEEALVNAKSLLDQAEATLAQTEANLKSAKANVEYQKSIQDFKYVKAPFDGVITYRKYDVGQYLSSTQTAAGQEVFDIQEVDKLRVFVNVPQGYANSVRIGQEATLAIRNFPAFDFRGVVALTTGAVDPNTRTLRVQVNFDNKDAKLFAGEYGELSLPVGRQAPVNKISSSGLIFNAKGLTVATITPDNKIHIKTVKVGRDFGVDLEITEGLTADDRVVLNPGERFAEGVTVEPKEQAHAPATTGGGPLPTAQPMPSTEPAMNGTSPTTQGS